MRAIVPISQLNRRLPEAGRLRTGVKDGKRPKAIPTWRITSADEEAVTQVAEIYGGTVTPWKDAPTPGQFEVTTEASELRIVLPPDPLGGTPIYEAWSGGGCQRRCDGMTCTTLQQGADGIEQTDVPCMCLRAGEMLCRPHTRLSVILPDVRFAGTWRYESATSWNVAQELPGMVDLIQQLQQRGLTRALLAIEHRKSVAAGQTRRFTIPVLRISDSMDALAAGAARVGGTLGAPEQHAALPAGEPVEEPEAPIPFASPEQRDQIAARIAALDTEDAGALKAWWKDNLKSTIDKINTVDAAAVLAWFAARDDEPVDAEVVEYAPGEEPF
jgi:hypothetical protein